MRCRFNSSSLRRIGYERFVKKYPIIRIKGAGRKLMFEQGLHTRRRKTAELNLSTQTFCTNYREKIKREKISMFREKLYSSKNTYKKE